MSARRPFYLTQKAEPPPRAVPALAIVQSAPAPDEPVDRVSGAEEIAACLEITVRQSYRLLNKRPASMPVKKRPVIGWTADRATLKAWWARYIRGEID
jgi:hypothetical protein